MPTSDLKVSVRTVRDVSVLDVTGTLDSTTVAQLERVFQAAMKENKKRFVFNLGETEYISSIGWGVFVSNLKAIREKGGDIVLCGMSPSIRHVYELLDFEKIIKAYPEEQAALAIFKK